VRRKKGKALNKPELLVSAGSVTEMKKLVEAGADAVVVGEHRFGLRLSGEVQVDELKEAIDWAHARQAKVYLAVNLIFDNQVLGDLNAYVQKVQELGADALVFGDPAVYMAVRNLPVMPKLHWNTEMTTTNYATANYWANKGATRAVLARELNMDEILEFKRHAKLEVEVQVHGITNIYHSKRELVKSYMEHQGKQAHSENRSMDRGLFLIEQERQDQRYPIYEDANGTHIMSSEDLCMLENLPELIDRQIDSLKIEGLMKSEAYNEVVVRSYRAAIDAYTSDPGGYVCNPEWLESIERLQDPGRELTYGFFYKEQVY
jgi:putative protease